MAIIIDRVPPRTGRYLAVLIAALVIVAVGTVIWLSTDNSAGTNSLASDERAMSRAP
jgi:TRAP-type C4-dicarboxylate transport system permease small subunit